MPSSSHSLRGRVGDSLFAMSVQVLDPVARFGSLLLLRMVAFGRFVRFSGGVVVGLKSVRTWGRRDRLWRQLFAVGTASVPVLAVTGLFIGMILAIEMYYQFRAIGQEGRLGAVINISLVKQIGPVLAAVILAGRVGCSLTAELGTMRVTEQLDAMRAMASSPVRVLVVPRVLACVLMIPALMSISVGCGVFGGWLISTQYYDASNAQYWEYSAAYITWWEVVNGQIKAVFFAGAIGLISCYKGFTCKPGAAGVGRATTQSFVYSFLAIIVMNLLLAKLLNDFNIWRLGGELRSMAH